MSLEEAMKPKTKEDILKLFNNSIYFMPCLIDMFAHHAEGKKLEDSTKDFMALNGLMDEAGNMSEGCHEAFAQMRENAKKKEQSQTEEQKSFNNAAQGRAADKSVPVAKEGLLKRLKTLILG